MARVGESANTGVGVVAVPVSETFEVVGEPFVRMAKVPVLLPVVEGVNVTLIVQLNPGFSDAPQLVVLLTANPAPEV